MMEQSVGMDVQELSENTEGLSNGGEDSGAFQVNSVRIQNFKKIRDTCIELNSITYLVGGNNSGKSSVLQALHTAVGCAQESRSKDQKVVAEASLPYSPVADFSLLGHGAPFENRSGGHRGIVDFEGVAEGTGDEAKYRIEMYKARNHSNVGVDRSGDYNGFGQIICDPKKLFSVYVPGLAGVPHREEMSGYAAVFRKAASGEANLVFRNIIRLLDERKLLPKLESLVSEILTAPVSFRVSFDPDREIYVDVRLSVGANDPLPVDLWGTGILQVTQIFAYVLLFQPALLLVDEPDSHLHPSHQKSLGAALERAAKEFDCKIIVSTHSRHLITGASQGVKVVWMKEGRVESSGNRELTALLMDLGALDHLDYSTRTVIYTEDENPKILRNALKSSDLSDNEVKIVPFNGLNNSFAAQAFRDVADLLPNSPQVFIHRDRDFLTKDELSKWSRPFDEVGIHVFCPKLSDTEAYCVSAEHISFVTGMSPEEAQKLRDNVVKNNLPSLYKKFEGKRKSINLNKQFYEGGGSPTNKSLWSEDEDTIPSDEFIYGKSLMTLVEKELRALQKLEKGKRLDDYACNALARELEECVNQVRNDVESS